MGESASANIRVDLEQLGFCRHMGNRTSSGTLTNLSSVPTETLSPIPYKPEYFVKTSDYTRPQTSSLVKAPWETPPRDSSGNSWPFKPEKIKFCPHCTVKIS